MNTARIVNMPGCKADHDSEVLELERLILAYQFADHRDKRIVWEVLNRYMPEVDGLLQTKR